MKEEPKLETTIDYINACEVIDKMNISDREKDELKWEAIDNIFNIKQFIRELKLKQLFQ